MRAVLLTLFWVSSFFTFRAAGPVLVDGVGPMPSFYWGKPATPNLSEYHRNRRYHDAIFYTPHAAAATLTTFFAVLVCSFRLSPVASAGVAFVLLLAAALVSDLGVSLGFWKAPL